jgi:hypothetical protein
MAVTREQIQDEIRSKQRLLDSARKNYQIVCNAYESSGLSAGYANDSCSKNAIEHYEQEIAELQDKLNNPAKWNEKLKRDEREEQLKQERLAKIKENERIEQERRIEQSKKWGEQGLCRYCGKKLTMLGRICKKCDRWKIKKNRFRVFIMFVEILAICSFIGSFLVDKELNPQEEIMLQTSNLFGFTIILFAAFCLMFFLKGIGFRTLLFVLLALWSLICLISGVSAYYNISSGLVVNVADVSSRLKSIALGIMYAVGNIIASSLAYFNPRD